MSTIDLVSAGILILIFLSSIFVSSKILAGKENRILVSIAMTTWLFWIAKVTVVPHVEVWVLLRDIDATLDTDPVALAIKDVYPQEYKAFADSMRANAKAGMSQGEVYASGREMIQGIVDESFSHASDDALIAYARVWVGQLSELKKANPMQCGLFFRNQSSPDAYRDVSMLVSEKTQASRRVALAGVIRSAGGHSPEEPLLKSGLCEDLCGVIDTLKGRYGDDVAAVVDAQSVDIADDRLCQLMIDYYAEVILLPEDKAGSLLRLSFSPG